MVSRRDTDVLSGVCRRDVAQCQRRPVVVIVVVVVVPQRVTVLDPRQTHVAVAVRAARQHGRLTVHVRRTGVQ